MHITGRTVGFAYGRQHLRGPYATLWCINIGWGEGSGEESDPLYRRNVRFEFRPWRAWFIWYRDLLTVEHGEPVYQDRIIGFWQWPMSVSKW